MDHETYIAAVRERLAGEGYRWEENAAIEGREILGVARKSGFRLTKFGNSEEVFVFGRFAEPDPATLRAFSSEAFAHGVANKSCFLPRGLFNCVWVFPVAVADSVPAETAESVRGQTPKKHWASAEVPSAFDLGRGDLSTFEKTPLWGAAYWKGFRNTIRKLLSP